MKYFLIAGEPSGDQHAAVLMEALASRDKEARFSFLGGDEMESRAGSAVVHIREMAFMGFTQIVAKLGKIRKNFRAAKRGLESFDPDVLILVDYPGFNLRMAKWAKKKGYKVFYYISPKVWAWNKKRVKKLEKFTDHIFSILPFEEDFFKNYRVNFSYVGNPVMEAIEKNVDLLSEKERLLSKKIAVLPGSRKQEIERILPMMLSVLDDFPEHRFVIAGMESHRDLYRKLLPDSDRIEIRYNQMWDVLNNSEASMVTSGTATLETSLMGVPQVVCYITNPISFRIARSLIKVPYISLVNLILDELAVPELIQDNCNRKKIESELRMILADGIARSRQLEIISRLRKILGPTDVSNKLSLLIINALI